jgi:hypothetical protein
MTADRPTQDAPLAAPPAPADADAQRQLPVAARRALEEAEARRKAAAAVAPEPEFNGRGGLDPARYGDWEVKGLAADF